MNKEEIAKIKEHIEIHARLEPRAIHITEIMRRAVVELEHIAELEQENAKLNLKIEALDGQTPWKDIKDKSEVVGQLAQAKKIIKKLVDGIRVISDPKVELTDVESFVAEAENFLKDSEVEK